MKGQVGGGDPATQLHLGDQGPPGHQRAPGGFAPNHRKVRRQEEIIWLQVQGFTRVVSLLPSSHNLQAYEEESLASVHFPLPASPVTSGGSSPTSTASCTATWPPANGSWSTRRSSGDRVNRRGGRVPPVVGTAAERAPGHHGARAHDRPPMGPSGRELVAVAGQLSPVSRSGRHR
jgi:hypothetical protein